MRKEDAPEPKLQISPNIYRLKRYILFFAIVISAIGAQAQAGYNYYELGLEGGISYERAYTNVPQQNNHVGFNGSFIYNYNPYLPIAFEIQKGEFSGGGLPPLDRYGRSFDNRFLAAYLHMDVHLGSFIDYGHSWILNVVKDFYAGSGFGIVLNNVVQRQDTNPLPQNGPTDYVFPGSKHRKNFSVPFRFGYEYKIYDSYNEPGWAIDVGYNHYIVLHEGLSGYDDPPSKFKNNAIDQYRQFYIGFKYFFGNTVSYNKLVRDYGF